MFTVGILTIYDLRLFWAKLKFALRKSKPDFSFYIFQLLMTTTMHHYIIGISLKVDVWKVIFHPLVKA